MKKIFLIVCTAFLIVNAPSTSYSDTFKPQPHDLECLSNAMYYEAGILGDKGMRAVGHVIINRTKTEIFPKTICGVINQRLRGVCQFSYNCMKRLPRKNEELYAQARQISHDVVHESDFTKGSLFFHTTSCHPSWRKHRTYTMQIGNTKFYA